MDNRDMRDTQRALGEMREGFFKLEEVFHRIFISLSALENRIIYLEGEGETTSGNL